MCTSSGFRSHLLTADQSRTLLGVPCRAVPNNAIPCRATPCQSGHFCFCSTLLCVLQETPQSDRCQLHLLTASLHCCVSLPPFILACSFLAALSVGCLLFALTRGSRSIGYQQSTTTRGNVQPVVRTWSSPFPLLLILFLLLVLLPPLPT